MPHEKVTLIIRTDKCYFFMCTVKYLGHTLSADGIQPAQATLETLQQLTSPTTLKELQAALGLINYYRKFLPDMAQQTFHMRALLQKNAVYEWTDLHEQEFRYLLTQLLKKPLLHYPCMDLPFVLYTDASAHGVGWILTQRHDDPDTTHSTEVIVRMGSKSLTTGERNASTIDRELLGILKAMRDCHYLIDGHSVVVFTDHKPLTYALKEQPCNDRNARVINLLLQYRVVIKYLKGKDNVVADALSRLTIRHPTNLC